MTATQELPRVKWRFRFPIGGFVFGMLGGLGVLVFLQQSAVLYPELGITIAFVLGGGVLTVLTRNIASLIGVSRLNARLTRVEQSMATVNVDAAPPVEEPVAAEMPTPAPASVAAEPEWEPAPVVDVQEGWVATHVVPTKGMAAWSEPDRTAPPIAQLEGGLELRVLEREDGLAHVEAYNGWTAWVEGRSLRRKHET